MYRFKQAVTNPSTLVVDSLFVFLGREDKVAYMLNKTRKIYIVDSLVIGLALVLFTVALFTNGLTHDVLLGAAVFLVSVWLIISTSQIQRKTLHLIEKLNSIESRLKNKKD